jgi:uncharacterized repeat protein (TIGR02543 family)
MTNGDLYGGSTTGYERENEAVVGCGVLGVQENNLIFLGYPDGNLNRIYENYTEASDQLVTSNGISMTYGNRGLGGADYHTYRFGAPAPYNSANIISDLEDIISNFQPENIFVTSEFDNHLDHSTSYQLLRRALFNIHNNNPNYFPIIHKTIVHWSSSWPNTTDPTSLTADIPQNSDYGTTWTETGLIWANRESIDVPIDMQSINFSSNPKYQAIDTHSSQGGATNGILGRFIHKDEIFWNENILSNNHPPIVNAGLDQTVLEGAVVHLDGSLSRDPDNDTLTYQWIQRHGTPVNLSDPTSVSPSFFAPSGLIQNETLTFELIVSDGQFSSVPDAVSVTVNSSQYSNIASQAMVTASSESPQYGQTAIKTVDGVISGYPGDYTREWATNGQGVGAWLNLEWSATYSVNQVVLYDRPNTNDNITSGTITFSDGSNIVIGPLNNDGTATTYSFPTKVINGMRITVTGVSGTTYNVGLSEIQVYGTTGGGTQYNLTTNANPSGSGTVTINPVQSGYYSGTQVTLTAVPAAGYSFSGWSGDAVGTTNPLTITITGNMLVTANFTAIPGSLTVTPTSGLTASGAPGGPFIPSRVTYTLSNSGNTSINWSASAAQGWVTVSPASGTLAPSAMATVTVSVNSNATALAAGSYSDTVTFTNTTNGNGNTTRGVALIIAAQYTLSTSSAPSGGGSVTVSPSQSTYSSGTPVTLTAVPNSGYTFSGWSGDATGTTNPLSITINGNTSVSASFTAIPGMLGITTTSALTSSGIVGGPFSPSSASYTLQNSGNTTINWSASATQSWITLSVTSGTLAPGATATVTVSINSNANTLVDGSYSDLVTFTNTTNGNGSTTRAVNLTVTTVAPSNIASLSTVTASSETAAYGQTAVKAVDGVISGYPGDYTREWATNHQGVGAWLNLAWSSPHSVTQIIIYDRPNSDDQITSGTITFSDGSSITVGPLNNNGTATTYTFSARVITGLRLTVTGVSGSTYNVGLSEIQVIGY